MLLHIVKLSSNNCRNSIFNVAVRSGWYKSIHTSSCIFNHYELLGKFKFIGIQFNVLTMLNQNSSKINNDKPLH